MSTVIYLGPEAQLWLNLPASFPFSSLTSLRGCREEGVTPWLLVTLSQRDGTEYAVIIFALIWGTDFLHSLADFLYLANVQIVIE